MRTVKTENYYTSELIRKDGEQKRADTHSLSYLIGLATKAVEQNDFESAIFLYSRVLEVKPEDSLIVIQRAELHLIMEQYDDAKSDIDYALYLEPENEAALELKEKILEKLDDSRKFRAFPIYS
jgi:tetratricopeptide (TPR) repeat protein